jgi:glycosyltransferase involved in cell wall biosynthesis
VVSVSTIGLAMSVYNGASTIDAALASVVAQTRRPDAVVIVDDGSTDATVERIDAWRDLLPLDVVVLEQNGGVAAGRTAAVGRLTTDLVLSLDADDIWLPHHLQVLERAYDKSGGVIGPVPVRWAPLEGKPIDWAHPHLAVPRRYDLASMVIMNWLFAGALFERDAFVAVGGTYRFDGCEDWDLWLRLLAAGVPGRVLEEPTVLYRIDAGSLSADDRGLPMEIEVLDAFLAETSDERLRQAARRSRQHRVARLSLRRSYELAARGDSWPARSAALGALRGPSNVVLRGAAMAVAPGPMIRRRQALHQVEG